MGGGNDEPAMQVIVLGSGGGPLESNTTAFLVRSLSSGWRKGCLLAVDAGIHLSGIQSIIETIQSTDQSGGPQPSNSSTKTITPNTLSTGAFAGLSLPYANAQANAGHIVKTLVDTYLITHPHLDHISGLVVNTAALPGTRVKRIAALPSTIHAFKQHIFNNVIWPNLSDENDGAGLVTYMRLVEGGSPALGFGVGRDPDGLGPAGANGAKGYVEITDGLCVKVWSVSHGHCMENHWHRGSSVGLHGSTQMPPQGLNINQDGFQGPTSPYRRQSSNPQAFLGGYGGGKGYQSPMPYFPSHQPSGEKECVYDSSAYFIRDIGTGREVLIFGDVEPDSLSLSPRNHRVWEDAAPRIAAGTLRAIFIECSYDERQSDDTLFGHLCPRFVMEELQALARQVVVAKQVRAVEKRQRDMSKGRNEDRQRKRVSGSMVETPTQGTFKRPTKSRDTSPLGLEVKYGADGDNYIDHRPTRRDFVDQSSGDLDMSGLSSPDASSNSVTAFIMESATRRKEVKKERNRLHRQSSSVSPHSRPSRQEKSLNGMSMDTFELDDHAPELARSRSRPQSPFGRRSHSASGQRPHSASGNRPSSIGGMGEWMGMPTRQERVSKDSITEENEGSGDATPTYDLTPLESTNSHQMGNISKRSPSTHANTFPQHQKERPQQPIFPYQTLPQGHLGPRHEPHSGQLSPTWRSEEEMMDVKSLSVSPAPTFSINTSAANKSYQHQPSFSGASSEAESDTLGVRGGDGGHTDRADTDGARSPVIEAIRASEINHNGHKESRPSTVGMLRGLKIVVIHVKERLDDEEPAGRRILRELEGFEREEGLGVDFVMAERGVSVFV